MIAFVAPDDVLVFFKSTQMGVDYTLSFVKFFRFLRNTLSKIAKNPRQLRLNWQYIDYMLSSDPIHLVYEYP